jgi:hypothetical protein
LPVQSDALVKAWESISFLVPKTVAAYSGARLKEGSKDLILRLLDKDCVVKIKERTMSYAGGEEVSSYLQTLVLHYLEGAGKAQLANRMATFRDFPGGAIYYPAFKARAIDLIVAKFGQRPDLLRHVGEVLRAEPMDVGTVSFKAYLFPKMPIGIILWQGDEEIAPSANILFDENAGRILPTEDLSVGAGFVVRRIVQLGHA